MLLEVVWVWDRRLCQVESTVFSEETRPTSLLQPQPGIARPLIFSLPQARRRVPWAGGALRHAPSVLRGMWAAGTPGRGMERGLSTHWVRCLL